MGPRHAPGGRPCSDKRRQAAGGRRQAAGGRRQAAGGRRQAAGGRRQAAACQPSSSSSCPAHPLDIITVPPPLAGIQPAQVCVMAQLRCWQCKALEGLAGRFLEHPVQQSGCAPAQRSTIHLSAVQYSSASAAQRSTEYARCVHHTAAVEIRRSRHFLASGARSEGLHEGLAEVR
jgi:hypothetical protein